MADAGDAAALDAGAPLLPDASMTSEPSSSTAVAAVVPARQSSAASMTASQTSADRALSSCPRNGGPCRQCPWRHVPWDAHGKRNIAWFPRSVSAGAGVGVNGVLALSPESADPERFRRPGRTRTTAARRCQGEAFTGRRTPQDVLLFLVLVYCQLTLVCLFLGLAIYDDSVKPDRNRDSHDFNTVFQDVHVMIFVGFGFLMMFLRKYGYSAVGFTLLLGAIMVQWAALCQGFFRLDHGKINLSLVSLLSADVATAAVLISMGAVLGKTTPLQLVIMGVVEMVFFAANEYFSMHVLQAVDLGGSMVVHVFGAYFGLAVSRALGRPSDTTQERSSYTSDMFSMVGTVFLWLFWPSFNGALATGSARHRAVINTYLALASGCVAAFAASSITQRGGKFNMVHVQNATLAGGVAMGTAADLLVQPVGALIIGALAGALSVVGYAYLQPWVLSRLKVHDTCGVHNLHGMPGVMAAIVGAIMVAIATDAPNDYGSALYIQFAAMAPDTQAGVDKLKWEGLRLDVAPGLGRSAGKQAAFQLASLAVTLLVSLGSGTLTGFALRQSKLLRQPAKEDMFEDGPNWDVPDEESGEATPPPAAAATAMATLHVATTERKASSASTEAAASSIPTLDRVNSKDEPNKW